ncbi:hypothetical protein Taro_038383 [Colocasia esculenta]|uniref:Uncharacterized protein n=1 Tax=Colocasia esculenta TaxID=4460 RepID=A0A843W6J0_COLES|nr:hypothetical protein [Colocasia esculenta]
MSSIRSIPFLATAFALRYSALGRDRRTCLKKSPPPLVLKLCSTRPQQDGETEDDTYTHEEGNDQE